MELHTKTVCLGFTGTNITLNSVTILIWNIIPENLLLCITGTIYLKAIGKKLRMDNVCIKSFGFTY